MTYITNLREKLMFTWIKVVHFCNISQTPTIQAIFETYKFTWSQYQKYRMTCENSRFFTNFIKFKLDIFSLKNFEVIIDNFFYLVYWKCLRAVSRCNFTLSTYFSINFTDSFRRHSCCTAPKHWDIFHDCLAAFFKTSTYKNIYDNFNQECYAPSSLLRIAWLGFFI